MRPFFKYFGSKWGLSKQHPKPIGTVCEPFAGSAGYSTAYDVEEAILIDIDPRVCSLWDYLINASEADIRSAPLVQMRQDIREVKMTAENRLLISCWINTASFRNIVQRAGVNGYWGESIRERIAKQIANIRKWKIIQGTYTQAPQSDTTYVDPPYVALSEHYKGDKLDYKQLGEWCKLRSGLVVVCENQGADWLPFDKQTVSQRAIRGGSREINNNIEIFWSNENGK